MQKVLGRPLELGNYAIKFKENQAGICGSCLAKTLLRRTFYGVNDSCLERVSKFKLLWVWQQDNLCRNYHVEQAVKKAINRLYYLRECRKANLPTVRDPRHHDILDQN